MDLFFTIFPQRLPISSLFIKPSGPSSSTRKGQNHSIMEGAGKDHFTIFHYAPLHSAPQGQQRGRAADDLAVTSTVADQLVRLPLWLVCIPRKPVTNSSPCRSPIPAQAGQCVAGCWIVRREGWRGQSALLDLTSFSVAVAEIAAAFRARMESPLSWIRWALWISRSRMASASVGSPR